MGVTAGGRKLGAPQEWSVHTWEGVAEMAAMRNWGQGRCCRPGNPLRRAADLPKLPAHPALPVTPAVSVTQEALRPRAGPSCGAWSQRGFART